MGKLHADWRVGEMIYHLLCKGGLSWLAVLSVQISAANLVFLPVFEGSKEHK